MSSVEVCLIKGDSLSSLSVSNAEEFRNVRGVRGRYGEEVGLWLETVLVSNECDFSYGTVIKGESGTHI